VSWQYEIISNITGKLWEYYKPKKMTWIELANLVRQVAEYFDYDDAKTYEAIDRIFDPEQGYEYHLKRLERELGTKFSREIESELERFYEEERSYIRERAEQLSVAEEFREEGREEAEKIIEKPEVKPKVEVKPKPVLRPIIVKRLGTQEEEWIKSIQRIRQYFNERFGGI